MADKQKTRTVDLTTRVTFNDKHYGPGMGVEVPADFPTADEIEAAPTPERVFRKPSSSPPNTGGVNTGENMPRSADTARVAGAARSVEELEAMDKSELTDLAVRLGLRVDRHDADGRIEEGEPLKKDYVRVLSQSAQ